MDTSKPIVFYDGLCGFCDQSVQFLLRIDRRKRLFFAPLQGSTAKNLLDPTLTQDLDSIVFLSQGNVRQRSSAILAILQTVGGAWRLTWPLSIIPRFLRDGVYQILAQNRYRWFGRLDQCRLPSTSQKSRFLD